MSKTIIGKCNCGRHEYTIPPPKEMNLCRMSYMKSTVNSTARITDRSQIVLIAENGRGQCTTHSLFQSSGTPNFEKIPNFIIRHSAHLFVKTADIKSSSPKPKTWITKAESGQEMERAWCDECGSGIWLKRSSDPSMTYLKAGEFHFFIAKIPNGFLCSVKTTKMRINKVICERLFIR